MPDSPPIDAFIPLSLLEAIRNMDTPARADDGLEEMTGEIVQRRLGLSSTVAAQIRRYHQATERGGDVPHDEVVSVLRLVGRRPDAALVFADAGRRAARYAARTQGSSSRTLQRVAPAAVGRHLGVRAAVRVARTALGAELEVRPAAAEARIGEPLSILATPDGQSCAFYTAAFGELLRGLAGFEGAMTHDRCRGRGDDVCLWRATAAEGYE